MAWPMPIHTEPCTWPSTRQPVERLAAVVRHPHLVDADLAGLLVDGHLHHLGGVAVAHGAADGRAAIFLAAVRFREWWNRCR